MCRLHKPIDSPWAATDVRFENQCKLRPADQQTSHIIQSLTRLKKQEFANNVAQRILRNRESWNYDELEIMTNCTLQPEVSEQQTIIWHIKDIDTFSVVKREVIGEITAVLRHGEHCTDFRRHFDCWVGRLDHKRFIIDWDDIVSVLARTSGLVCIWSNRIHGFDLDFIRRSYLEAVPLF